MTFIKLFKKSYQTGVSKNVVFRAWLPQVILCFTFRFIMFNFIKEMKINL